MGDKIIITDEDEDKPKVPEIVVVERKPPEKSEKVVTEKTVVTEVRDAT